jgi:hypothetical protein
VGGQELAGPAGVLLQPSRENVARAQGRGPLLLTMGKQAHTVPEVITKSTLKQYRHSIATTDLEEFDRGHSLVIDSGWCEVAGACLAWLAKYDL